MNPRIMERKQPAALLLQSTKILLVPVGHLNSSRMHYARIILYATFTRLELDPKVYCRGVGSGGGGHFGRGIGAISGVRARSVDFGPVVF